MKILFFILSISISQIAFAESSMTISNLDLKASSVSTLHAFAFFEQSEQGQSTEMVDILCADNDIRLRIKTSRGIREFRSTDDFYCYSGIALVKEAVENSSEKVSLKVEIETVDEKNEVISAVFSFGESSSVSLYEVEGTTLGQNERLTER